MNPDILKAVEIINQRIAHLEQIKSMILSEFGAPIASPVRTNGASSAAFKLTAHDGGHVPIKGQNGKRKEELKQFLVSNGPSKRAKIIAESGIPRGTIAYLLNSNSEFVRRNDGKWQVDIAPPQVQ